MKRYYVCPVIVSSILLIIIGDIFIVLNAGIFLAVVYTAIMLGLILWINSRASPATRSLEELADMKIAKVGLHDYESQRYLDEIEEKTIKAHKMISLLQSLNRAQDVGTLQEALASVSNATAIEAKKLKACPVLRETDKKFLLEQISKLDAIIDALNDGTAYWRDDVTAKTGDLTDHFNDYLYALKKL